METAWRHFVDSVFVYDLLFYLEGPRLILFLSIHENIAHTTAPTIQIIFIPAISILRPSYNIFQRLRRLNFPNWSYKQIMHFYLPQLILILRLFFIIEFVLSKIGVCFHIWFLLGLFFRFLLIILKRLLFFILLFLFWLLIFLLGFLLFFLWRFLLLFWFLLGLVWLLVYVILA